MVLMVAIALVVGGERASAGAVLTVTRFDDPPPNGCAPNDCSLREAVIIANAPPGGHSIVLAAGTYNLTRVGPDEDDALTGDLDLSENVTITGVGSASTIIDGNDIDRILHVFSGVNANVSSLTLRNGDASLEVPAADGGAVSNQGTLTLTDVDLRQNTAEDGGAIVNAGMLTLTKSRVIDNTALDAGGGLQGDGPSNITLTNSTVSGNQAGQAGGGASLFGVLNADGSTFSGNTANGQGGGVHVLGTANFTNSTISGNNALGFSGGGINTAASTTLTNVTITGNSSGSGPGAQGGGINVLLGSVSVKNSIIANNPTGGDCSGSITSDGHNTDSDDTCSLDATGDIPSVAPMIAPLASGLGPTQTHALLAGSPAIDTADGAACPATDQRGVDRPLDGDDNMTATCDIGAYEIGPLDSDSDGCTDEREAQTLANSEFTGGLRDYEHFWDFFDVPTGGSLLRDKSVSAPDIFQVIGRFNASGDSNIDPLSSPSASPAYHTAYDRNTAIGDPWDLTAANGSIAATDIFGVLAQFNHSCA
jgi:hypothetical protein